MTKRKEKKMDKVKRLHRVSSKIEKTKILK